MRLSHPRTVQLRFVCASIVFLATLGASAQTHPSQKEQTNFSAENEHLQYPCPIPPEVIEILRKDGGIGEELDENSPNGAPYSNLLEASIIHLRSPSQNDMIVVANGALAGANVTRFWILTQTAEGMKLVVNGAGAHDLEIKNERNHGYRNIVLLSATAVTWTETVLHFDGNLYREFSTKTHRS